MQMTDFDIDLFLRDHWQKAPLLIRRGLPDWINPLEPDELAGLACEEGVESRLIERTRDDWRLSHGPFPESRFGTLGKWPWTLLVQAVDQHVPAVAALIEPFRFVPNWRIDDVMVSYAADGGGVGPHFDQYDVFLIQGLGRRRWRIGALCDEASALLPHDGLRLLATFEVTAEWLLEPGDILYVPPGWAHDGVAEGDDCMTYSIGFRAPSSGEMIADYCDHLVETMERDERYGDPDLRAQDNPGEIAAPALARLHAMVTERLRDAESFARWFGRYSSTPKYPETDWERDEPIPAEAVRAALAGHVPLRRNPASRFSFIRRPDARVMLFVDGADFPCAGETVAIAEQICARDSVRIDPALAASPEVSALIAALIDQGSIAFEPEG